MLHQFLRAGDASFHGFGVERCLLFQGSQAEIDARQRLGDDIMQFATDPLALVAAVVGVFDFLGMVICLRFFRYRRFFHHYC